MLIFDIWFNNSFSNDLRSFIEIEAKSIEKLSIPEYILYSLDRYKSLYKLHQKYFPEEYLKKIMDIIYKNLFNDNLVKIENYFYNCNNNDEIIKLLNEKKDCIIFIKLIGECFILSSNKRGVNILDNKIKTKKQNKYAFIELKRELEKIFESIYNNQKFKNDFYKGLTNIFNNELYSKELAYYYNDCMRRGFKGKAQDDIDNEIDKIIETFNLLSDKCLFKIYIEKQMSERLINNLSLSLDTEKKFILKLKNASSLNYIEKMSTMINDLEKSKIIKENYNNILNSSSDPKDIKFNVTVISQGSWDIKIEDLDKIELPKFLSDLSNDFQKYYFENFHHKLFWCHYLSKVDIKYLCLSKDNNNYTSKSTLIQLLILLLIEKYNNITIKKIAEILGCRIGLVFKDITGLIFNPSFNPSQQKDKGIIMGNFDEKTKEFKEDDEFCFNYNFYSKNIKFNTLPLNIKKSEKEIKKEEEESKMIVQKFQNNNIQATLTRIMKSKNGQKVEHVWLINEVSQKINLFNAQPQQIKENIEKLIEKNIIRRVKDNISCYEYIA